jgi:outer membrane protein OmpA-like peptidoglycan-associated protein
MRLIVTAMLLVTVVATAAAEEIQQPKGTWQQPGPIQQPKGTWQQPGEIRQPRGTWQQPGEIQQPTAAAQQPGEIRQPEGHWVKPGPIQEPKGPWIQPGEIQVPKGIQAVRASEAKCERRFSVVGDALFDFDKANLRPDAEETLSAAGPEIAKLANRPAVIEGHTDAKGSDSYNQKLSEARARSARDWLAGHGFLPNSTPIKGFGKTRPVAPNETADGLDDPEGRQKNRRVEIVFNTCG